MKEDLVVTAQYVINTYNVTFVDWNGTTLAYYIVEYGSAAQAPVDPDHKEGWHFTDWDVEFHIIIEDLTVTALYEECNPSEKNTTREATCEEDGTWEIVCIICSKELDEGVIEAAHKFDDGTTTEPTCADGGYTTYTCSSCGYSYEDDQVDPEPCGDCEICIPIVALVKAENAKFVSISETSKNSRQWRLIFTVDATYSAGANRAVEFYVILSGNNANLDGRYSFDASHDLAGYTLTYDIKGNGSSIKEFKLL